MMLDYRLIDIREIQGARMFRELKIFYAESTFFASKIFKYQLFSGSYGECKNLPQAGKKEGFVQSAEGRDRMKEVEKGERRFFA